jgi:phosphoglycolate phosphatase-like HAD superfamily hydrolase
MLENYKVILWDFDGVLIDSNAIRNLGFKEVLSNYPLRLVNQLINYHNANGGLSRYVKFRYFFEEILKKNISTEEINLLADQFSVIMRSLLINKELLIQDSINFVKQQFELGIKMHIVSGSDLHELRNLCRELEIEEYFLSILGSPVPKKELVENLIKTNQYNKEDIILIGDSINDYEAATDNGVRFYGYNNMNLAVYKNYITSFNDIQ